MKAKNLMGMIACASACVSLSAFGNTTSEWFRVSVANSAITVTGDISQPTIPTTGVTVGTDKITLDNDSSSPLTFAPTATAKSTGVSVITATAELTPSDAASLDTSISGAKVGFAVGVAGNVTNYYGFANNAWFALSGPGVTPPDSGDTTFTIILDYRTAKAQFLYGDINNGTLLSYGGTTEFSFNADSQSAVAAVDAFGSGSITSLVGGYEVAVAMKGTTKYGSVVEAVNAAGEGDIQVVDAATGGAASDQAAANGLPKWQCDVLNVAEDAAVALEPATKAVANKITLKLAESNTPDAGVTVKFGVNNGTTTTGSYDADCIEIPLTDGTYTIVPSITAAAN